MSAPVDVLAVMDALVESCARGANGGEVKFDGATYVLAQRTRAAVADLIEAAQNVERQPALDDATFMVNRPRVTLALIKLRAALARVQGGQP